MNECMYALGGVLYQENPGVGTDLVGVTCQYCVDMVLGQCSERVQCDHERHGRDWIEQRIPESI